MYVMERVANTMASNKKILYSIKLFKARLNV